MHKKNLQVGRQAVSSGVQKHVQIGRKAAHSGSLCHGNNQMCAQCWRAAASGSPSDLYLFLRATANGLPSNLYVFYALLSAARCGEREVYIMDDNIPSNCDKIWKKNSGAKELNVAICYET